MLWWPVMCQLLARAWSTSPRACWMQMRWVSGVKRAKEGLSLPFTRPSAVRQPATQKFVGVECHRIACAAFPVRDLVQERQGIVICDEDVKPPPTLWVGFQMVQTAIAMVSQDVSNPVAER